MKQKYRPHPPTPSPSGQGGEKPLETGSDKEAVYRAMASQAMVQIARDLRQRETEAEVLLWEVLRNRRLGNLKFRRQHPIANTAFVADFFCYQHRLVIELDGGIHKEQSVEDKLRQQAIEEAGCQLIRFHNDQVTTNLETVLIAILTACESSPLALSERGRG